MSDFLLITPLELDQLRKNGSAPSDPTIEISERLDELCNELTTTSETVSYDVARFGMKLSL